MGHIEIRARGEGFAVRVVRGDDVRDSYVTNTLGISAVFEEYGVGEIGPVEDVTDENGEVYRRAPFIG
ncbi:hypothetical protein [Agromyces sp. NPDC058126]|uniref:hypothetical protein n=1 Tax=Agromyces sp. NPDC058126 TaxID=3346350 RepID=UPI0036DB5D32